MIKKWTTTFSPQALRKMNRYKEWARSAGMEKGLKLMPYLIVSLFQHYEGGKFEDDCREWGTPLAKVFNLGHSDHDDFFQLLRRGIVQPYSFHAAFWTPLWQRLFFTINCGSIHGV